MISPPFLGQLLRSGQPSLLFVPPTDRLFQQKKRFYFSVIENWSVCVRVYSYHIIPCCNCYWLFPCIFICSVPCTRLCPVLFSFPCSQTRLRCAASLALFPPLSLPLSDTISSDNNKKRKILRAKGNHPVPDGIVNDALQTHLYIIHETWPRHRRQSDQCRRDFGLRRPLTNRSLPSTQLYCVS